MCCCCCGACCCGGCVWDGRSGGRRLADRWLGGGLSVMLPALLLRPDPPKLGAANTVGKPPPPKAEGRGMLLGSVRGALVAAGGRGLARNEVSPGSSISEDREGPLRPPPGPPPPPVWRRVNAIVEVPPPPEVVHMDTAPDCVGDGGASESALGPAPAPLSGGPRGVGPAPGVSVPVWWGQKGRAAIKGHA